MKAKRSKNLCEILACLLNKVLLEHQDLFVGERLSNKVKILTRILACWIIHLH
jgi:hypothetical protein